MGEKLENFIAVVVLSFLIVVYLYLLANPKSKGPSYHKFVIPRLIY
jgi:hypothetical protein